MGKPLKIVILSLTAVFGLFAQHSWQMNLFVNPRPSQFIEDWRRTPNIVNLSVTYTGTRPVTFRLKARLRHESLGQVLTGFSRTITLRPFQTVRINNTDLVDWSTVEYPEPLAQRVMRTGRLPAGSYTLCVDVVVGKTVEATRCADFLIVAPSPPRLLAPRNGDTLFLGSVIFRWSPIVVPPSVMVNYRIRVWEFMRGDDVVRAMKRTPIIDETVPTTTYIPRRTTVFERGHAYIWAVQSVDSEGNPIGENNGMSEVWGFFFGYRAPGVPSLPGTLVMGGFIIHVDSYSPDAVLSALSGEGQSFFHDEATGSRVTFHLSFSNLSADSTSGDTAFISNGQIVQSFSSPIEITVAGFRLHITELKLWPDSAQATLYLTHPCLYDTGSSNPWMLGSITTKIDTNGGIYAVISSTGLPPFRMADLDIYFQPTGDITINTLLPSATTGGGGSSGGGGGSGGGAHHPIPGGITPPHGMTPLPGRYRIPNVTPLIPGILFGWRGVVFSSGQTIARPELLNSNIGYLYGVYSFSNAVLADTGLTVELKLAVPLEFRTIAPYDFYFHLDSSYISINRCKVVSGKVAGYVEPPSGENGLTSISSGGRTIVYFDSLVIDSNLTLSGTGSMDDIVSWGNYRLLHRGHVHLRFTANARPFYSLVHGDMMTDRSMIDLDTLVGMVIRPGNNPNDTLFILSEDAPGGIIPLPCGIMSAWLVLDEQGVTGSFDVAEQMLVYRGPLGRPGRPGYLANRSFNVEFRASRKDAQFFYIQFAGNSLFDARLDGKIDTVPKPSHIMFPFEKMSLTSVAMFIGGDVRFDTAQTLDYWGVNITSKSGYVSVRTGEVIFTNADISEPVHFSKPFNIIWGDILADGLVRRMDFNHNCAFQKFDGFPITLDSAALSKYDSSATGPMWGALVVRGGIHFKFFGESDTLVTVFDHKYDSTNLPYHGRYVYIDKPKRFGLKRSWGNHMAFFDLDSIYYDTVNQFGFRGGGSMTLEYLHNPDVEVRVQIDSGYAMVCIVESGSHAVGPPSTRLALLQHLWGCAYIEGDSLKRIVLGGDIATSVGGVDVFSTKSGMAARMVLAITPTITQMVVSGKFVMSNIGSIEIDAYARLTHNRAEHFIEGDIQGIFKLGNGIPLAASNAYAKGHFTFHLGNYTSIQGEGELYLMSTALLSGVGGGVKGGFFMGVNVPKEKAWVLRHETGRFGVDMDNLPSTLTGVYGFVDLEFSFDIGVFGGGIEVFVGLGAMTTSPTGSSLCNTVPLPYVVGDIGVYLYGEILWGLVSASGSIELEFVGGCDFAIQGTLTLRGCALWVLCAEVDLTVGLSRTRGFYVE